MARKKKHPEHVNHERWLVSYADFITLLFAFFTTLYAISTVDAQKVGKMVYSMQQAFNADFFPSKDAVLGGRPVSSSVAQDKLVQSMSQKQGGAGGGGGDADGIGEAKRMRALAHQVVNTIQARGLAGKVSVRVDPQRGVVISLAEAAVFGSGEADFQEEARETMEAVAEIMRKAPHTVRIEGHTDDRPIRTSRYPSNWELSTARAVNVSKALIEEFGFSPARVSAAGYASHRPVAGNDTSDGRSRNRRVDIVLLNDGAASEEPSAAPPADEPEAPSFLPPPKAEEPPAPESPAHDH